MYKVENYNARSLNKLEEYLNAKAADGWILVSARWKTFCYDGVFIFRRSSSAQYGIDKDYACENPMQEN